MGMGMVLGFYVAECLNIPKRIISIIVGVAVIASMTELAKRQELVTSAILTILLFILLFIFRKRIKAKVSLNRNVIVVICLIFTAFFVFAEKWYLKNEFRRYSKMVKYSGFWPEATDAWNWLNINTTGNNIAYAGRPVPFPLYGSNFKNNVYYVSVNKTEPAKLHYFLDSKYEWGYDFESQHKNFEATGNYRGGADFKSWSDNLTARKIDYLFVYSLHQTKNVYFPMEDTWARAKPDKFSIVYSNPAIHIYKVNK